MEIPSWESERFPGGYSSTTPIFYCTYFSSSLRKGVKTVDLWGVHKLQFLLIYFQLNRTDITPFSLRPCYPALIDAIDWHSLTEGINTSVKGRPALGDQMGRR